MVNISKSNLLNLFEKITFPLSANQVLKELKLSRDNKRVLKDTLKNLLSEGKIKKVGGGKYLLRKGNSKLNDKPNKNSEVKINANTEILGDLIKQEGSYFLKPRNDELPVFKVENSENTKLIEGNLVLVRSLGDIKNGYPLCGIIKTIGKTGEIKIEKEGLLIQHGLNNGFPKTANNEARSIPESFEFNQVDKRVDLTKEIIFTIDGDDAKDFDDAVGIKKLKSGYKLWVSIADVSHYVKAESPLDVEANKRATSTYLSDRVIPMLPEKLSNNLCSLIPHETRFTKTAEINFDLNGNLKNYKLYNSFIKSSARLTYGWVSGVLNGKIKPDKDKKSLIPKLQLMLELYKKLKKNKIEKGELEFDFPEPNIIRDDKDNVINIQKSERNIAHGIIEEFMIAANSVVAEYIFKHDLPSIYRIHEKPDEAAIFELRKELDELGIDTNINSDVTSKDIQKILVKAKKRNDSSYINMMVLRSLKKAVYSTKHIPHFGLAIDDYTHFTSPIRRYSDLIVHRILDSIISKNKGVSYSVDQLNTIAERCSIREREAERIERESVNLESTYFMKNQVGNTFNAKVISIHPFGVFIELDDYFVEGLIPKQNYRVRGKKRVWFELGDRIPVKLVEADILKRRLTFNLIQD